MESAEQLLNEMTRIITPIDDTLELRNGTIYAKVTLHRGFKLGPYPIQWKRDPVNENIAWKVGKFQNSFIRENT